MSVEKPSRLDDREPGASQLAGAETPAALVVLLGGGPRPAPKSLGGRIFRVIGSAWMKLLGWKFEGEFPANKKCVVIGAPHTSNWDLPHLIAIASQMGIKVHWLGKKSIFKWPFAGLMKKFGGIPIDRSKANNAVEQTAKIFGERDEFYLVVPPEGTRGKVKYWKTGFYYIAHTAGVPIVLGFMDYRTKTGGVGPAIMTTGDYDADMKFIRKFYAGVEGKYPDQGVQD